MFSLLNPFWTFGFRSGAMMSGYWNALNWQARAIFVYVLPYNLLPTQLVGRHVRTDTQRPAYAERAIGVV